MPREIRLETDLPVEKQQELQRAREASQEMSVNEIATTRLSQIDAKIDSLSNLAELKVFLKKLSRFIIASRGG